MEVIYADNKKGILKEISANCVRVPFGDNLGPSFYYKQNGKQFPIDINANGDSFTGELDGIRYSIKHTDCNDYFKITATIENNSGFDFYPEAIGLKLGIDTYMIEYPQWNDVFFPTLLRCEKSHFWGYFMSPLQSIVSISCDTPIAAWELDYSTIKYDNNEDYGHRIYTANLILLSSAKLPSRHPQHLNVLKDGHKISWEINLLPQISNDNYRENLSEKFNIPVIDSDRYTLSLGETAKFSVWCNEAYTIYTTTPSGKKVTGESIVIDEYGVYDVKLKTISGKECESKLYCRHDYGWYLKNARVNAINKPQKASTHVESWYGLFSAALAKKHFPEPTLDKIAQENFDQIIPIMYDVENGKPIIIPQRIQNTACLISLLVDMYETDKPNGLKYLEWANNMADDLISRQTPDGAYRNKNDHYTAVIYIAKSMLELALCEKQLVNENENFEERYMIHYNSAKAAIEDLCNLLETIGTEGEGTLEDGMISCSALQIGFFALTLPEEERGRYIKAAEHMMSVHRCLEQSVVPDCRMRGASLRFWEAQYDIMMQGNMFNSPHGWTSWKNYATYYLYLLTGKEEYLRDTMDTIGACMQMIDENGDLRWAFIVDPCVNVEHFVPDLDKECDDGLYCAKHLTTKSYRGKYERIAFGEQYIPMISGWYRTGTDALMTGGYQKCPLIFEDDAYFVDNQGGCCDNDVHEHFKCLEETVFKKAFVIVREDYSVLAYNCSVALNDGVLTVKTIEDCNILNVNTAHKIKVLINDSELCAGVGMTIFEI